MKALLRNVSICLSIILIVACNATPDITDEMLDGDVIFDPSLYTPEDYLVSAKYPAPTQEDLKKHVLIASHGYSASTFEWDEFMDWSTDSSYRISSVLLDGHGRTYEDFRASKWEDWRAAIIREYELLEDLGYTKISLVGSSTSAALLVELMQSGYFNNHIKPKNIFLVDPIIVPTTKLQSIADLIGPMLVYIEVDQTAEEDKYWYHFRPHETVSELNEVIQKVRKGLEKGITVPSGTHVKSFHSKADPTASTTSTVLIYKGLEHLDGSKIDVQLMDSDIHVFTRLSLRPSVSPLERSNQLDAFTQISKRLN
jgi:carboxylesterase